MLKKIFSLGVCLVIAVVMMVGCATTVDEPENSVESTTVDETDAVDETAAADETDEAATDEVSTGGRTIGLVLISGVNSHCQALEQGVREVVEANGDKLIVLDSQFDTAIELQCLEDLITQKVDGIVLEVLGFDTSTSALIAAADAGIPIAACDQFVNRTDLVVSEVVSDNLMAGTLCAQDLVAEMGEEGEVLVIDIPGVTATEERKQGFLDEIGKYPGIEVVGTANGEGLIDKATTVTEALMQANPNVKAVFGVNGPCALGALAAYDAAGKIDDVFIYGVDGSIEEVAKIDEGKMTGTVRQKPYDLGRLSALDLYTVLDGGTVEAEKVTYIDVFMINSDNVADYSTSDE